MTYMGLIVAQVLTCQRTPFDRLKPVLLSIFLFYQITYELIRAFKSFKFIGSTMIYTGLIVAQVLTCQRTSFDRLKPVPPYKF